MKLMSSVVGEQCPKGRQYNDSRTLPPVLHIYCRKVGPLRIMWNVSDHELFRFNTRVFFEVQEN